MKSNQAHQDTIFALSTPPGRSGVAVIRISGQNALASLNYFSVSPPKPRMAKLVRLIDPISHTVIDQSLILYFAAPNSFTGEDVVELHIHGGRAIMTAILRHLTSISGFRPAMAGEFTRRAFDHDKLDLTEVEGLADLIDADTEFQRRQAMRQLSGELGRIYQSWQDRLVRSLAYIEAYLDFPDEEIPPDTYDKMRQSIIGIADDMRDHLSDNHRGERLRTGLVGAIIGAPNAGKSSLLNALARREAAIVSAVAGTTRDVITVDLDVGGYPITLADTAGLRDSNDEIEREGIRRSKMTAQSADFKILLLDAMQPEQANDPQLQQFVDDRTIIVWNKIDAANMVANVSDFVFGKKTVKLSAQTGYNQQEFLVILTEWAAANMGMGESPAITRTRHRSAVQAALDAITRFVVASQPELAAEDLRLAVRAMGAILGKVDVEDLLDIIFRDFCIGK